MTIEEIKNIKFLGQVLEIVIFYADFGKWFLTVKTTSCGYVKLYTSNNTLWLFKSLDAANKIAVDILRVDPSPLLDEEFKSVPFVRIVN